MASISSTPTWTGKRDSLWDLIAGRTLRQRQARIGYLFILPTVLYVFVIFLIPTAFTLVLTFFGWDVRNLGEFAGFAHYQRTFADPAFTTTMRNSLTLAVLTVPLTMVVALLAALALQSSSRVLFRNSFRLFFFLPVVTSTLAMAYVWKWLLNSSYGLVNQVLTFLSLPPQLWLDSTALVLPSLAVISVWARFGFDMLIFIAGLEGISQTYYEAARLDGASRFSMFRDITIPLLNPQFVLVGILETIHVVKIFDIPYAATEGGPGDASRTAVMYIYDTAFGYFDFGRASVSALVLFAVVIGLSLLQRTLMTRTVDY